jgi:hypothetical protein
MFGTVEKEQLPQDVLCRPCPRPPTRARHQASAKKARRALRGDDEFSVASIEEDQSGPVELSGAKLPAPVPEDELERTPRGNFWGTLRRVFIR